MKIQVVEVPDFEYSQRKNFPEGDGLYLWVEKVPEGDVPWCGIALVKGDVVHTDLINSNTESPIFKAIVAGLDAPEEPEEEEAETLSRTSLYALCNDRGLPLFSKDDLIDILLASKGSSRR